MRLTFALLLALLLATPARADEARRLTIAGGVLTGAGLAVSVAGAGLLIDHATQGPIDVVQPRFCIQSCDIDPKRAELAPGWALLGAGLATATAGAVMIVVSRRHERRVALSAANLVVRF